MSNYKKEALELIDEFAISPDTADRIKTRQFALYHARKLYEECDINRKVFYFNIIKEIEKLEEND